MTLICELLTFREDMASKDATVHIDTNELRVIEAKTKHAVKFFNYVFFDDENYQPYKYGTRCYFIDREKSGQGNYKAMRFNFDSKQFIGLKDMHILPQEVRSLCESYPKLYDIFEADAKKNGVFSAVKYDDIDPEMIEKKVTSLIKNVHHKRGRTEQALDTYEFKRWFAQTFGYHKLTSKLQDAFVATAKKHRIGVAFLEEDIIKTFDPHHLVDITITGTKEFAITRHLIDMIKDDHASVKRIVDHIFNVSGDLDSAWEAAASRVVGFHEVDLSEYISSELAVKIGAFAGLSWLTKLNVDVDEALANEIIDVNPKRITDLEADYKSVVTNKLKERARIALLAKARK